MLTQNDAGWHRNDILILSKNICTGYWGRRQLMFFQWTLASMSISDADGGETSFAELTFCPDISKEKGG